VKKEVKKRHAKKPAARSEPASETQFDSHEVDGAKPLGREGRKAAKTGDWASADRKLGTGVTSERASRSVEERASAPATPSANDLRDRELEGALQALPGGVLTYPGRRDMKQGEPSEIWLRVSRGSRETATEGLPKSELSDVIQRDIPTSVLMRVTLLYDSDDFKVAPISSEEQTLVRGRAEWRWLVTPLTWSWGQPKSLHARVSCEVKLSDGSNQVSQAEVAVAEIHVRVSPSVILGSFISKHWDWLFGGAGGGAAVVLLLKRLVDRRPRRPRVRGTGKQ
jgi:hypothetical protein